MNRAQRRHAPPSNGIALLPQLAAQSQPQPTGQPMFNVGPLMNDVQLVAMVAAAIPGPAKESVARAIEITAIAVAAVNGEQALTKRIKELMADEPVRDVQ